MTAHRADVELRLPADGAFAAVLRTTAATLAARLDFTIDDIEDLRILVGEVSALLIPEAAPGSDLVSRFHLGSRRLQVELVVDTPGRTVLDEESFAWQVLTTLAEETTTDVADDHLGITVTLSSSLADGAGA